MADIDAKKIEELRALPRAGMGEDAELCKRLEDRVVWSADRLDCISDSTAIEAAESEAAALREDLTDAERVIASYETLIDHIEAFYPEVVEEQRAQFKDDAFTRRARTALEGREP